VTLDGQPNPAASRRPARSSSILIIEDHADTRRACSKLVSSWGHRVVAVGTVAEALQMIKEAAFDVIMSDINLPDGDGWELMRTLRAQNNDTRAIAVTARGGLDDEDISLNAGFDYHFKKPIDVARLRDLIAV
jgi:CheY-like chemotaxis protein